MTKTKIARIDHFSNQLASFEADKFQVIFNPATEALITKEKAAFCLKAYNAQGVKDQFFTADDLLTDKLFKLMSAKNIEGYDVTIVPKSKTFHYLTISSVTSVKLKDMASLGFAPTLVTTIKGSLHSKLYDLVCRIGKHMDDDQYAFNAQMFVWALNKSVSTLRVPRPKSLEAPIHAAGFKHHGTGSFVTCNRSLKRSCTECVAQIQKVRGMKLTAPAVGAGSPDDTAFYLNALRETLVYKSRLLGDAVVDDVIDRRVARQAFAEHYSGDDVLAFLMSQGHVKARENAYEHAVKLITF